MTLTDMKHRTQYKNKLYRDNQDAIPFERKHTRVTCCDWLLLILGWVSSLSVTATELPSAPMRHGALGLTNLATIENNQVVGGFKYDFLENLGQRLGIKIKHSACPFQRCLRSMSDGNLDVMVFIGVTPERSNYLKYIQIWQIPRSIPFYVRKGEEHRLQRYEDLHQLHIGIVNGYAYFSRFDNDAGIRKSRVMREQQLVKMLQAGRIDAYIAFDIKQQELMEKHPNIIPAPFNHAFSDTALLAISHKSPYLKLMPQLEQAALELIREGTMDTLWQKHFDSQMPYPAHLRNSAAPK
jgi:polar amino acid transport system substrate-binding protein